jgi:signal transduction histidine kinase
LPWPKRTPEYGFVATLLLGFFFLFFSALREPETVVEVIARKQDRALPPFEFITDRDRLLGLLFEPLCPPPPSQRPLQLPVPAVADCGVGDGHVWVRLRPGKQWRGQRLDARQVEVLLQQHEARRVEGMSGAQPQWDGIEVLNDGELRVRSVPTAMSAQSLHFALSEMYLAAEDEDCRIGTGPWNEVHCAEDDFAHKRSLLPSALRDSAQVTDIAVLERRDWLLQRRQVLVVGWDFETAQEQGYAGLVEPLAQALQAGEGERVHLIRGLEAPEIQALRENLPTPATNWSLVSRRGDRTAWLVARPTLPEAQRLKLLSAAREVLQDPDYFDEGSGSPVRSLLPEVYRPLIFSKDHDETSGCDESAGLSGSVEDHSRIPILLTHTRWKTLAEKLKDQKSKKTSAYDLPEVLNIVARNTKDESKLRRDGQYDLSIQSPVALDASHPSRIFADNLTAWFRADHPLVRRAHRIADAEAKDPGSATAELEGLMRCLDAYMLPLSSPPSWVVVHRDLRGWNAAADWLNPADVGLRSYGQPWLERLGLALVILPVLLYPLRRYQLAERARNAAEIASFHHDLSSPLASIRAEAEYLREDLAAERTSADDALRSSAEFIDQQTSHVIDLVDNLRAVSGPDDWLVEQDPGCELVDVIQAEIAALQRRAKWDGMELRVQAEPANVRVALPASSLRRVLRNLLDNACKYRNSDADVVNIRILTWSDSGQIMLDIEDDGLGFEGFSAKRRFVPRQRGRGARERRLPGQGLGLSSAERLLASAGASIEIHHLGKPTRIRLRLPVVHGSAT